MRVRWLRQALRNLDREAAYIARDNPRSAAEMVSHLLNSTSALAHQSHLGRPGRVPGTRELVIARYPYILPYRVRGDAVKILRVFHTARRWPEGLE